MFVKIQNGTPIPYTISKLRYENPETSFPNQLSDETLAEYGLERLTVLPQPDYDPKTHKLTAPEIVQQDGQWVKRVAVVPLTSDEIAEIAASDAVALEEKKRSDYQLYSDPVFFKWQAGEATQQDWLDARATVDGWYQ